MENDVNCFRLVERAQLGDKESLERLAKLAEESLRENVYRMTLGHDLTASANLGIDFELLVGDITGGRPLLLDVYYERIDLAAFTA